MAMGGGPSDLPVVQGLLVRTSCVCLLMGTGCVVQRLLVGTGCLVQSLLVGTSCVWCKAFSLVLSVCGARPSHGYYM